MTSAPCSASSRALTRNGGQPERFRRGAEELLRMRLEGEDAERGAALARQMLGLRDQRLMAAMHAVEIADRHHRALEGAGECF